MKYVTHGAVLPGGIVDTQRVHSGIFPGSIFLLAGKELRIRLSSEMSEPPFPSLYVRKKIPVSKR